MRTRNPKICSESVEKAKAGWLVPQVIGSTLLANVNSKATTAEETL